MANDLTCQLLSPITVDKAAPYLADSRWLMQPKYDGKRIILKVQQGVATALNRKSLSCPVPRVLTDHAVALSRAAGVDFTIDGEMVGATLYAFDLLHHDGTDCRPLAYSTRIERLDLLLSTPGNRAAALLLAETAAGRKAKRAMAECLKAAHAEGFVLKKADAPFRAGRGNEQLKVKFWATASVLVAGPNGSKHSVTIALLQGGEPVPVGHVTLKPWLSPQMPVGTILEVRYLYAFPETLHLYQPTVLNVRDDIDADTCTVDQLKFKAID